jgi:hypothetical protein
MDETSKFLFNYANVTSCYGNKPLLIVLESPIWDDKKVP